MDPPPLQVMDPEGLDFDALTLEEWVRQACSIEDDPLTDLEDSEEDPLTNLEDSLAKPIQGTGSDKKKK